MTPHLLGWFVIRLGRWFHLRMYEREQPLMHHSPVQSTDRISHQSDARRHGVGLMFLIILFVSLTLGSDAAAQDDGATSKGGSSSAGAVRTMSPRFIPDDAFLVADLQPAALLQSPEARFFPTEVMEVWCDENVGVQPKSVQFARFVMPMPAGPGGPPAFALVVAFQEDVSIEQLNPNLFNLDEAVEIEGKLSYRVPGREPIFLMPASSRLWLLGTESYLPAVMAAAQADRSANRLTEIVDSIPARGHLQVALDLEPIQPLARMVIMGQADEIPPSMGRLPELINHLDAAWMTADLTSWEFLTYGQAVLRSPSDESADQVEQIIEETVEAVRSDLVAQALAQFNDPAPINRAWQSYIQRVSLEVAPLLKMRREGRLFYGPDPESLSQIGAAGIAVGLLLPAVQSARQAARRMSASNNLKQIGLAMHNYHSVYGKLPAASSSDQDGNPLLSWRVAILPFIEEQELYERFHLDEPWDSPHNIELMDEMPDLFKDPSIDLPPGQTIYHAPVEATALYQSPTDQPRFRDVLDGLSNTLMAFEGAGDSAVPWTQPVKTNIDLSDPLASTGDTLPGGFHVLMGDGSVQFLTNGIDPAVLSKMITRSAKDPF